MQKRIFLLLLINCLNYKVFSATTTTSFNVTATVINSCSVAANNLSFGTYDPNTATPKDATTTLTVTCTNGLTYDIGLDGGNSGDVNNRYMINGSNELNYTLYRDTARTQNWGTTIGVDTYSGIGSGSAQTVTVYGRISAGQVVPFGTYTDTINVTVTFP